MTRIYGYAETLYDLMPLASRDSWKCDGEQVPGFVEGQVLPNPYQDEDDNHSPIGSVLCTGLGVDVDWLEQMSTRHVRDCEDTEDPDEPCVVCAEGADNSIYSAWVQQWFAEEYEFRFTEEALDLLWDAERSGLTLDGYLEEIALRKQAGWDQT